MYVIWMWRLEENWNVSFILSMCRGVDEYGSDRFCGKKGCGYVIIGLVLYADYTFSQVTVITMKWSTSE